MLLAIAFSLCAIAAVCTRFAVVSADAEINVPRASTFWPAHPDVLRSKLMMALAQAALGGGPLTHAAASDFRALSKEAPLNAVPFAVDGAGALRAGRLKEAENLLLQARARNPRNAGVRFLLASLFLRENGVVPALRELAVLTHISRELTGTITEAFLVYAKAPGAPERINRVLAGDAVLKKSALRLALMMWATSDGSARPRRDWSYSSARHLIVR